MVPSLLLAGITVRIDPVEQGHYDLGAELRTGATAQFGKGLFHAAPPPVREVRNYIVETLSHGDDSRSQRNLVSSQPLWITCAVISLMVVAHDAPHACLFQRFPYLRAPTRVAFRCLLLFRLQVGCLIKNGLRHMKLAEIVEDSCQADLFDVCLGSSHLPCDLGRQPGNR
jgi:hypothetical protein